jgi:predicted transcriptional regulator
MVLHQTMTDTSRSNLLSTILENESSNLLSTGFDEKTVGALIRVLGGRDDLPNVLLLTTESVLKWVRDDFILASEAADLIENESLSMRTSERASENQLIITTESAISLVSAGEHIAGLPTDNEEFVGAVNKKWNDQWNQAEEFSLRTPARSRVEESLGEQFSSEVETDFRTLLDAIESTRGDESLDVVDASLLVAAKHELLLYDISKWGEEVGVASKATFSRAKTNLEENGLIKTEKVPIDVGRPRLRLLFGKDELQNADIDDLPDVARRLLSGAA